MRNSNNQVCLAAVGGKSPILKYSARYLRLSYYITNALIFLTMLAVFGYVKWQQLQDQRDLMNRGSQKRDVIVVPYVILPQPKSITGSDGGATGTTPIARGTLANLGTPKPVQDDKAVESTMPTQDVVSGPTDFSGPGADNKIYEVDTATIPGINDFVFHEVEPKFIFKPRLEYPEAARSFEYEGTVFVKALLDFDGSIMKIAVMKTSNCAILDSAAVDYIANCKFSPALQKEKPVRVWIGQTIYFKLK